MKIKYMNHQEKDELKKMFLGLLKDSMSNFFYYDRKDDTQLSSEDIEDLIFEGHVTLKDIIDTVTEKVKKDFPEINEGE